VVGSALILIVVTANVFARFVLNQPFYWSEEVTAIMVVFITLLPAAFLWRQDWHIKLDMLLAGKQNTAIYQVKQLLVCLATIFFSGILAWQTVKATVMVFVQDMREPSLLGAPLWISYSALLVGSVVLLLAGLSSFFRTARKLRG
jgi:TRAP-type C4-dicarboxylate transport system permease small subunit